MLSENQPDHKTIIDYFDTCLDYAKPVPHFHPGVLIHYISESFLDGWINYVEIQKAFVVLGYYHTDMPITYMQGGQVVQAVNENNTIEEGRQKLSDFITKPGYHTKIGSLGERVHLLCRGEDGSWWYFEYDPDVSDCSIGHFFTRDSDEQVLAAWENFKETHADPEKGHEVVALPKECFKGWLSF